MESGLQMTNISYVNYQAITGKFFRKFHINSENLSAEGTIVQNMENLLESDRNFLVIFASRAPPQANCPEYGEFA